MSERDIENTAYLWFSKGDGWQVTSFDPRKDPALGVPNVKLYVPKNKFDVLNEQLEIAIDALTRTGIGHYNSPHKDCHFCTALTKIAEIKELK